jgi:Mrp family chromosome partitioning ATPase
LSLVGQAGWGFPVAGKFMDNGQSMKLWSIGGGKGGVGKSIFTMALGITLARLGNRVILVDGDLGGQTSTP